MSLLSREMTASRCVGGKAAVLAELRDAGFAVPAFEVSPSDLFGAMQRVGAPVAARSCATLEDGDAASFAGQFHTALNVGTADELEQAVAACRASVDAEEVQRYCGRHGIDASRLRMDVIVQKMVSAQLSGVAFSIDPMSGADRVVIEACEGQGDQLLGGRGEPVAAEHPLLQHWRPEIETLARDVQRYMGTPQDIEFAIDGERLWLLQARPITRIAFPPGIGEWTNADFRDGGVSASVCSPLMWSLYERAWRDALLGLLREIRLLGRGQSFETGRLFFGRPYWNLGGVKRCLAKLPGYVERKFEQDLSVEPLYEGDGEVTPATLRSILRAVPTAWALPRFFRRQEAFDSDFLTGQFEAIARKYEALPADSAETFAEFVEVDFLATECAYFRTIFAASLAKLDFTDAFPDADATVMFEGLPPLRHFAPLRQMRQMAETGHADIQDLLHRYRHHHPSGLDVIHPRWDEQPEYVKQLAASVHSDSDEASRRESRCESATVAREQYVARLPRRRRRAFNRKLDRVRQFLYLREEMRDCSSRLYYVIRRNARAIARRRHLADEIFFMTTDEIIHDDRSNVAARRDVYQRFRRFDAPHEIRSRHASSPSSTPSASVLRGLGASQGCIRGTARVVRTAGDVSRVQPGSILVCPFIDPGWTCALDRAAAVVTETGGLLSHAAVICREFGLPAVLGVNRATSRIHDGATIEVDGSAGTVRLITGEERR